MNPYKSISFNGDKIEVGELDLNYEPPRTDPKWSITPIKDYAKVRRLYLDIETTGLDPETSKVIMIGVMTEGDFAITAAHTPKVFSGDDEPELLKKFSKVLSELKPEIISLHNGVDFDIPFLIHRYVENGLPCPFRQSQDSRFISAASLNGRGIDYKPVMHVGGAQIIDTLHLAAQLDKVKANMSSYTLKYLALYTGKRKERRLEIPGDQIKTLWESGDRHPLIDYLKLDLEDQKFITDYFLPTVYYQKMFIPLDVQALSVASPAKKWNTLLSGYYGWNHKPTADEKMDYVGGTTGCNPGMYRSFFKIDVSSLYPSLVLRYGLTDTKKDPKRVGEKVLRTLRDFRYIFKAGGNGDFEKARSYPMYPQVKNLFENPDKGLLKSIDGSLKVLINGYYGFLGVGGYPFNSPKSAALVTAYGRLLMEKMVTEASKYANVINIDTDGLCLQPHPGQDPVEIHNRVQSILPESIKIDLEDNFPDGAIFAPKMKNYLYWPTPDSKPVTKGLFRKRNRCGIQIEFPIEFCHRWAFDSFESAIKYYEQYIDRLENSDLSIEEITFSQRIPKGNKTFVESGLGEEGDKVHYYWGSVQRFTPTGKLKKRLDRHPVRVLQQDGVFRIDPQEPKYQYSELFSEVNRDWYIGDVEKIFRELTNGIVSTTEDKKSA
jgi:DNA polymerase I